MQTVRTFGTYVMIAVALSCSSSGVGDPRPVGVQTPQLVQRVEVEYPAELRRQRVQGVVVIGGTVPKEGGVLRNPHVVKSDDLRLNQAALDAVSRWVWRGGVQNGEPVDVETTVRVTLRP